MKSSHKVIVLIPGGRRAYLMALMPFLFSNSIIDEIHILINTKNEKDIEFMMQLCLLDNRVKLIYLPSGVVPGGNKTVNYIYCDATDDNTIYIKIDDDIIFLEDNLIEEIAERKIKDKNAFLVSPIVINNVLCAHMLQKNRKLDWVQRYISANAGGFSHSEPQFAEKYHKFFIDIIRNTRVSNLHIHDQYFASVRFSINCIAFSGCDMRKLEGRIKNIWRLSDDDEEYLSVHAPSELNKYNVVCGNSIAVHHSFYTQTKEIDRTQTLFFYQNIASKKDERFAIPSETLNVGKSILGHDRLDIPDHCKPMMLVSFPQQGTDFFCDNLNKTTSIKYFREFFNPLCNKKHEENLKLYCGDERKDYYKNICLELQPEQYQNLIRMTWGTENYNFTKENYSPCNILNHASIFSIISLFRHRSLTIPTTFPHLSHATLKSFLENDSKYPAMMALKQEVLKMHLNSHQKEVIAHLVNWYILFKGFEEISTQKIQKNIPVLSYADLILLSEANLFQLLKSALPFNDDDMLLFAKSITEKRYGKDNPNVWICEKQNVYKSLCIEDFYQEILHNIILKKDQGFSDSIYYNFLE